MDDLKRFVQFEASGLSRRLRGMAMISRGIVPNLVISQRVVDKITGIARQFIADETGESMVGMVMDSHQPETMPTIYVLDTISPDEEETLRRTHTFQQGDDLQDEIIWWLQENWRLCRDMGMDSDKNPLEEKWLIPLRYVGDWHKQPGYMIQPSGGDLMTALAWLDDEENMMEYLLVPIVTLGHPATTYEEGGAQVNYFTVSMNDGTNLRVDWWYIHRDVRVFQPITPLIMSEDRLPKLAGYPWHLTKPDLAEDEVGLLRHDGLFVELVVWQADGDIPMELCFFIARPGASKVLLVVTEHDYPNTAPRAYASPFTRFDPNDEFYDIFEQFWVTSEPIADPENWEWSPKQRLLDYIHALEDHLGIAPVRQPKPEAKVSIAVEVEGDNGDHSAANDANEPVAEAVADDAPDTDQEPAPESEATTVTETKED